MLLKKKAPRNGFNNVFLEKQAANNEVAKNIIKKMNKKVNIIEIDHYKDIFNAPYRDYDIEKRNPSLILAVNNEKKIYKGSIMCNDQGYDNFYYLSNMKNCLFDCEYCYLQGMYTSGHIVVFVNFEDYISEIEDEIGDESAYLSISYDTDLLALEGTTEVSEKWHQYAKEKKNILFENRTKSINEKYFENIEPISNMIYSFSVLPEEIRRIYEKKTPSTDNRIKFLNKLSKIGYKIRICIDPIIYVPEYKKIYFNFINKLFDSINKENVVDINIGFYRMPKNYYNRMIKKRPENYKTDYLLELKDGYYTYNSQIINNMRVYIDELLYNNIDIEKVEWYK